jgi:hypothetical protein
MYYNSRTSPHHHAMREDLYNFVQYSSERPKPCEAEVLQYYQQFLHLSVTVLTGMTLDSAVMTTRAKMEY